MLSAGSVWVHLSIDMEEWGFYKRGCNDSIDKFTLFSASNFRAARNIFRCNFRMSFVFFVQRPYLLYFLICISKGNSLPLKLTNWREDV